MNNWCWAQYVVLFMTIIETLGWFVLEIFKVMDGRNSRGELYLHTVIRAVWITFYVYMLHVGGFW